MGSGGGVDFVTGDDDLAVPPVPAVTCYSRSAGSSNASKI